MEVFKDLNNNKAKEFEKLLSSKFSKSKNIVPPQSDLTSPTFLISMLPDIVIVLPAQGPSFITTLSSIFSLFITTNIILNAHLVKSNLKIYFTIAQSQIRPSSGGGVPLCGSRLDN